MCPDYQLFQERFVPSDGLSRDCKKKTLRVLFGEEKLEGGGSIDHFWDLGITNRSILGESGKAYE